MFFNSSNHNKINITINDSHVECHTYLKRPPSNNKMYIKGYHITLKVIMLAEATFNYIWQELSQIHIQSTNINQQSAKLQVFEQLVHHVLFLPFKNKNVVHVKTVHAN